MYFGSRDFQIANNPSIVYKIKKMRDMEITRPNNNHPHLNWHNFYL